MGWLRTMLAVGLVASLAPVAAAGEQGKGMQRHGGMGEMPHRGMMMEGAAERHEAMMERMRTHQEKLDELVAAMEAAEGQDKVEAIAAVVEELVTQRKARMARMQEMHERMMDQMREGEESGTEESADPGY